MAGMDMDSVQRDLTRRFSVPLPEFYQRRIIFWYDPDKEFADILPQINLDGVKIVHLNGGNTFAVKKLLCVDDTKSNYLVYDTRPFMREEDNWLINVQLYSEEFRADLYSIWIDEMNLSPTPVIRSYVKSHRKFFNSINRRQAVAKFGGNVSTAAQMHLAVMSVLCEIETLDPGRILCAVLCAGLDTRTNPIYSAFVNYGMEKAFWTMIAQATGYSGEENASLEQLSIHLFFTAAGRTIAPEFLSGLDQWISTPHAPWCYDFLSDWLHSDAHTKLYEIARYVETETRFPAKLSKLNAQGKLDVEDIADTEIFPCIDEILLTILMTEIQNHIIQVDAIHATVEKRRTMVWYQKLSSYYEGLVQIANMQMFFLEHADDFHTVEPYLIWTKYTTDYYRMDTCYRLFHLCFQKCLKVSNPLLDDLFKGVVEEAEGLYSHWFLNALGENWSNAAADELRETGKIEGVKQQENFYVNRIASCENRIFVIVSDALRYEVAAELCDQLRQQTQCKASIHSMQAMFPTVTKFGMAALLPHQKLEVTERSDELKVLADGQSTEAGSREKVLKAANKASVALQYDDLIGMKRLERAALVKGMEVVYIYHDKIDEASHISDSAVFSACEEAIAEMKNAVRIIVNEFGGTNILITSDHGFLYTCFPLSEDDKVDKTTPGDQDVEVERRYLITRSGAKPEYLLPVKFIGNSAGFQAWAPRESIRIKKRGGSLNFVHGGISLQEMVVPVIEYQFLRNAYKSYQRNRDKIDTKPVTVSLLSASRKISNMIFALNFFQQEAVGDNRTAAVYQLYFTDRYGQKVSDTQKIIADRTSTSAQERTFRCNFNLRSRKYDSLESYYLVIADESGLQAPVREEFQINIAFAVDEFNFF